MNKKVLVLVLLLSLVSVLFGPIVIVKGDEKETLTFYKVHKPVAEEPYFEIAIPDAKGTRYFSKTYCDVPAYVINIGGDLDGPYGPPFLLYWIFDGGTTYLLDRDFTYEGSMFVRLEFCWDGIRWIRVYNFDLHGVYTFTESATSIHRIEGTLEFYDRVQVNMTLTGGYLASDGVANGHGTGDLNGVTMKATEGPLIATPQTGISWATLQGTIDGWSTYLNK
jgi:hypothetical protein